MVVVDTHVWLWWMAAPDRLSRAATAAIEEADAIGVCAVSCWEVAMLTTRGRIKLDREPPVWLRQALGQEGVVALPLMPAVATDAALLDPSFPGDPADRFIYSTARSEGAPLVTRDQRLREFDPRGTIW
jgi:PIN domain nuclease of toxin-antitoxin system